uniref:Uncharacterized protein n=1 Tax=Salix viminalis TaxID=40686 RepID=A0A6N2MWV0_SALVM
MEDNKTSAEHLSFPSESISNQVSNYLCNQPQHEYLLHTKYPQLQHTHQRFLEWQHQALVISMNHHHNSNL